LGGADEGQRVGGKDCALAIEVLILDPRAASAQQDRLDGGFKRSFAGVFLPWPALSG
jgi:hypothetical protein